MTLSHLIDTDWAIHYLNGHSPIVSRLQSLASRGLAIPIVAIAELYEGVYYSRDPSESERKLRDFLRGVSAIGVDEETCKIFGKERGRLRAAGKTIGDFDLLIGSIALQHKLVLLTNNRRHFEVIEGLRLESLP